MAPHDVATHVALPMTDTEGVQPGYSATGSAAHRDNRPASSTGTVAVVGTDRSGVVTLWSGGASALFGWAENEALGRPIAELADWGLSRKDVTEFLFVGTSGLWVHEHDVTTRTRDRIRLKTTASLVTGPNGTDEIIASSMRVELPEGRFRLAMTERPFRVLLERSSDLVVVCDRNLVIGYLGPSLGQLFGCLPRELIGHSGWDFVHPEDVPTLRRDWEAAVSAAGESRRLELRVRNGAGGWRWVEARVANLLADLSVGAMVINLRDITEQRETAQALAATEHLLRLIVDASSEGVCVVNPQGTAVLANDRMAELLAVDHVRLLSGTVWDFFDAETVELLRPRLRNRAAGIRELYEYSFQRLDGQRRWLRISGIPWYDLTGRYMGAIGMFTDITEEKQREELAAAAAGDVPPSGPADGPPAGSGGYSEDRFPRRAAAPARAADPATGGQAGRQRLPGLERLSRREVEVVQMLLLGDRVPVIARQLFISQSTVRNHLSSVFRKLRVNSQQELIVLLRERDPIEWSG